MTNIFGMRIDFSTFEQMQYRNPGAGLVGFEVMLSRAEDALKRFVPHYRIEAPNCEEITDNELAIGLSGGINNSADALLGIILAFAYGCKGILQNTDFAERLGNVACRMLQKKKPHVRGEAFERWVMDWAYATLALGLVYALKRDFIKASYYLIIALKTKAVNINLMAADYIRLVLEKLKTLPAQEWQGKGAGFSPKRPAGAKGDRILLSKIAVDLMSRTEGCKGEQLIFMQGMSGSYGSLDRMFSTEGKTCLIDAYSAPVIDASFHLYKATFYINNYVSASNEALVFPRGFRSVE